MVGVEIKESNLRFSG